MEHEEAKRSFMVVRFPDGKHGKRLNLRDPFRASAAEKEKQEVRARLIPGIFTLTHDVVFLSKASVVRG